MLRYLLPAAGAGLSALVLQACATGPGEPPEPSAEAAATLAGFDRTGDERACLNTRNIDTIEPLDERFWLIETRSGDVYLNQVGPGCFGAANAFTYLQYDTPGGQLCRGEIIDVVDQNARTSRGACGLGSYERLTPVE